MAKKHSGEAFYALDDPLAFLGVDVGDKRAINGKHDEQDRKRECIPRMSLGYIIKFFSTRNNRVH